MWMEEKPKSAKFNIAPWLDALGRENIRPLTKDINICSLHFEESAFNRTLEVVRLRDEAIPSLFLLPHASRDNPSILTKNTQDVTPVIKHGPTNLLAVETAPENVAEEPVTGFSQEAYTPARE
ncbi:THAP domain-containing protein 9 [Operophtera brumata]|uniref:THAP domain-containing protein 9 n=1 Tax=Operophtera brumata TaxID=104452 RepID=A0A0L7LMX2_OPEBR|nr:THAP domain-containing protein 9 [Operophtera brumata]